MCQKKNPFFMFRWYLTQIHRLILQHSYFITAMGRRGILFSRLAHNKEFHIKYIRLFPEHQQGGILMVLQSYYKE